MNNQRFDVCIISDRESPILNMYINENMRDLKVIQCFNFSLKEYFKTNFKMSISKELKFMSDVRFNVGYYEDIIKNSEFIFFDLSVFNVNYIMVHLGIAIGLNKPIYVLDRVEDATRGRFGIGILNKLKTTKASDEIERKWLISEELYNSLLNTAHDLPSAFVLQGTRKITQFIDDDGVRYRKVTSPNQYIKCIKSGKSEFTRFEVESLINKEIYDSKLFEFKNSDKYCSVINKERTIFNLWNYATLELNKHKIGSNYFYTAEIEYPDHSRIRMIDIPMILNSHHIESDEFYEFTNSKTISNKVLMKLNARKKTDIEEFSTYVNSLCNNCFVKIEK